MIVSLAISELSVRGGTHKQLLRLAEFLTGRGDEVEILTPEYLPDKCYPEFSRFTIKTPRRSGASGRLARMRQAFALAGMIDPRSAVLNVHDVNIEWIALAAMLRRPSLPIFWQINDLHPSFRVGPFENSARYWTDSLHRTIDRFLAREARLVSVNVTKNAERVKHHLGVAPAVFYPGVDCLRRSPVQRRLETPLEIISIGVLFRYRNYEAILDAMALLREQGTPSRLTVVGETRYDPAYAESLNAKARQFGLDLDLAGQVTDERLQQLLERARVFAFVNIDQSWGLAVFEAMGMSLPVVLSESVGAVELLRDSAGVAIVDPQSPAEIAEALRSITASQAVYDDYASAAFRDVQGYTWDRLYSSRMREAFAKVRTA